MNLINADGTLRCTLLSELGLERATPSSAWERKFLSGLRKGKSDFIYNDWVLDKLVNCLRPNEIIEIETLYEKGDLRNYYKLTLTTYQQQMLYYKQWCVSKNLDQRNAVNLRRFIKEVKVIWVD